MPEMPFYNKNEPKGEWPGGSTGCAKFSLPEVSVFLLGRELKLYYLLSCAYKASGMAVLALAERSSVVEQLAYIQRCPGFDSWCSDWLSFYREICVEKCV